MKRFFALLMAGIMLISLAACGNNGFDPSTPGGGGGGVLGNRGSVGNIYEKGYMAFLGDPKDDVLPRIGVYEHHGEFEGSDLYKTEAASFAFDMTDGKCVYVSGKFFSVIPGFDNVDINGVVSKDSFDQNTGIISVLHTSSETGEIDVPSLVATNGDYMFVIKCDMSGNIKSDDLCQVYLKSNTAPVVDVVTKKMYVVDCIDCVNLRKEPSTRSEILATAPLGAEVGFISEASGGFYKVTYAGKIGYMSSRYLADTQSSAPIAPDGGYTAAYAQVLRGVLASGSCMADATFNLVYIDDNNTPELVYNTDTIHANGAKIYTYKDGQAVEVIQNDASGQTNIFGSLGCFYVRERSNMFVTSFMNGGYMSLQVYKLDKNIAVKLASFENTEGMLPSSPEYGKYYADGVELSRQEYNNRLNSFGIYDRTLSDHKYVPAIGGYTLNESNIASVLQ